MLQVAEEALVRDVLYACQGVNGQFVQYDQDAQQGLGGYVLNAKAGISAAHRPVMLAICELGWLFRCAGYGVKPSLASAFSRHRAQILCSIILCAAVALRPCKM